MKFVNKRGFDKPMRNHYEIYDGKTNIGEITYITRKNFVIIGHLFIWKDFQHQGYGYAVVEYLMKKYPNKSIVGETLKTSRGFWNKCILKYGGTRRNFYMCDNCTSSFVIPRRAISYADLWKYLGKAWDID